MADTVSPTESESERRARHRLAATREAGDESQDKAAPTPVERLWASIAFWRVAALAAGALALGLAVGISGRPEKRQPFAEPLPQRYVALLQEASSKPRWLVTIDVAAGTMMAEPLETEIPPGQAAELWLFPKGGIPQSLGLLDTWATILRALPPAFVGSAAESAALGVTLEPSAGSPTGVPTGAVLYQGAAIQQAL